MRWEGDQLSAIVQDDRYPATELLAVGADARSVERPQASQEHADKSMPLVAAVCEAGVDASRTTAREVVACALFCRRDEQQCVEPKVLHHAREAVFRVRAM